MSNIPTPHISAKAGDFAPTVLMPGDPLRSQFIAENFLCDARLVNDVRGIHGYTGTYNGKRVSVMASGMGMPSMGIYSYELFNFYGVERILRVGSAGAMTDRVHLNDVVAAMSAYAVSGYGDKYAFSGHLAPACSYPLLKRADEAAQRLGISLTPGAVFSSDAFYEGDDPAWKKLSKLGVTCVEMETFALYLNAAEAGKEALSLLTISDSLVTGESLPAMARQTSFTDMIRLALEIA
ncbi:MAG: purine-nucleoside phosphorylase [Eubacteriales bacterium]|nr:purine-nucleoside phosphorylase [Eubacteriales bacterium]